MCPDDADGPGPGTTLGTIDLLSLSQVAGTLQCGEYIKVGRKHPCPHIAHGGVAETEK